MAMGKLPGADSDDLLDEGVFAEINITPLTDIFLVLLIIFMVTSTVMDQIEDTTGSTQSGMKVNLPKGGAADVTASRDDLPVAILTDGRVVLAGNVVTLEELGKAFEATKAKSAETLVIVQADEGVPHGKVVEVMELAKKAGLGQLAIGVREESQ
jgi:biopolymer transport protein ExbD